jgi:AraC-like DNA-binding protein
LHPRSTALKARVVSIDVVASDGAVAVPPSTGAVLGVQLRGRVTSDIGPLSTAGVTGIPSALRRYAYEPGTVSVLVRFTPQGASCLGVPPAELAGTSASLEDILPAARVERLREALADAGDRATCVSLVEDLLLGLPLVTDHLVEHALTRLASGADDAQVAAVARELGVSERQLERRMLQRVGLTPKRFATLSRFQRALALVRAGRPLGDVAWLAGYCDPSHLVREVRRFTGMTPGELARVVA